MRRRVVRDLGTILGIVVVLAVVVGVNIYMRLGDLVEKYDRIRRAEEANRTKQGITLLDWELLRKTKGTTRSGATFPEDLKGKRDQIVNIMGFMTPIDQFRDVEHFMLLPLPIQCYFCEAPPMRDIILVKMAKGDKVNLVEEPVLITGRLILNEGPKQTFFYTLENSTFNMKKDEKLTPKQYPLQHRQEGASQGSKLLEGGEHIPNSVPDEQLLPPAEVPTGQEAPAPPSGQ
ncbi:MAG: DUF3299 domain-containing protein [Candidatus Hydrogenedentales bacterium]